MALTCPKCKYPLGSGGNLVKIISPKFLSFHSLVSLELRAKFKSLATKSSILNLGYSSTYSSFFSSPFLGFSGLATFLF